jgi:hypothetical protein
MLTRGVALILTLIGCPAVSQERISPEALLDRLAGRTAVYERFRSGYPAGVEQYLRRDRTIIALPDGTCGYGFVYAEADMICFEYDFEPAGRRHCWAAFVEGDRLMVVASNGTEIQEVVGISDTPVACTPPATS